MNLLLLARPLVDAQHHRANARLSNDKTYARCKWRANEATTHTQTPTNVTEHRITCSGDDATPRTHKNARCSNLSLPLSPLQPA
eukprot:12882849-Alexandrium_andersonii.AAC.1